MKVIISIASILIFTYSLQGQTIIEKFANKFLNNEITKFINKPSMQEAPVADIENIIFSKINELRSMGKYFKYYDELNNYKYIVASDLNKTKFFIKILKNKTDDYFHYPDGYSYSAAKAVENDNILDIIEFNINMINNYPSIEMKDFDKYVNQADFMERFTNNMQDNFPLQHNLIDKILIDKEIGNLSLINPLYPNLGKIINKTIINQRTRDPNGQISDLFADATAGTVIPLPTGVGNPKVFIVDKIWCRIIMMDRDIIDGEQTVAYAFPKYPVYSLSYPTDITSGAKRFSNPNSVVVDSIVSLYVSDFGNDRIVRLDYVMQYNWHPDDVWRFTTSYIRDSSLRVLTNNCQLPYSIAIHPGVNGNLIDSTDDVLWYSEGTTGNKRLVCVNAMNGQFIQEIRTLMNVSINPSRISVYRSPDGQRNILAFIDESSNSLVIMKLETNGTFINSNLNFRYFQDFGYIKLKSVLINSYNNGLDGTTIWAVGDGGNGGCFGNVNCGYVSTLNIRFINNFPTNVEYLATYWMGLHSPNSFVNIQNIYSQNGFLDLVTMEKWTDQFGLRKYKPGIGIVRPPTLSTYCTETGRMNYTITLTNPSKAYFRAEHKPPNGQWTPSPLYISGYFNYNGQTHELTLPSGTQNLIMSMGPLDNPIDRDEIRIFAKYLPSDENFAIYNPQHLIELLPIKSEIRSCNVSGGGCPFLLVDKGNEFVIDNNILHRSEFDENIGNDIEDKYMLRITPSFNQSDTTCNLKIKELNNDISYFDKFTLVAIDHPMGTNLGITENNDYVVYFPSITSSPKYAEHNGEEVTSELNYDSNYTKVVQGEDEDNVSASYEASKNNLLRSEIQRTLENSLRGFSKTLSSVKENSNRQKSLNTYERGLDDSVAVLIDPSESDIPIGPPNKIDAGEVEAFEEGRSNNPISYVFAKRQNTSPVIISVGKDVNIDSVSSKWYSDFKITYLAVTPVYYGGYIENSLTLIDAQDSLNGNVLSSLTSIDSNYSVIDSTTNITLKFKNTFGSVPAGFVRDYVLITNGRYENVTEGDNNILSSNENQNLSLPTEYKLHQNYPNPFNPVTTIKFDLPKEGLVSIKVFDILGKEVYTFNEVKQAGYYQVNFNGSNFASGMYFYRIIAGDFSSVKRMVLVK